MERRPRHFKPESPADKWARRSFFVNLFTLAVGLTGLPWWARRERSSSDPIAESHTRRPVTHQVTIHETLRPHEAVSIQIASATQTNATPTETNAVE